MIPLLLCVIVILYAVINSSVEKHTSLSYNILHADTAQAEKIIDSGVSPDCNEKSNTAASNGEKTLLYLLAEGAFDTSIELYNQNDLEDDSKEDTRSKTLEMMGLLIEKGADVNYVVYSHDESYAGHRYEDKFSIYEVTDRCAWTPLMAATYRADFDMIKLLVDNGADVNAVDYCGYNVIDIIADYLDDEEEYEILNYYLEQGVDPNTVRKL